MAIDHAYRRSAGPGKRRDAHRVTVRLVACVAALAIDSVSLTAQPPAHFTLGDSRAVVRRVQGAPPVIERLGSLGVEHWTYDRASVTFEAGAGTVIGWNDPARTLRARLHADTGTPSQPRRDTLRLGDTRDDVVRRLGTPWAYTPVGKGAHALLAYGNSLIRVRARDLVVDAWLARDPSFPVAASERDAAERAMAMAQGETTPLPPASLRVPSRDVAAPPSLRGEVRWRDADGDGVLSPGERLRITLDVHNEGRGRAVAVTPTVVIESPRDGLRLLRSPGGSDIAPGGRRSFDVDLLAADRGESSEVVMVVGGRESRGFDLVPELRVRIPARASGAPRLVVRELRVDDASRDGRISPREVADLTVTVENRGDADTAPLRGRFLLGQDLFVAAGMPDSFSIGGIAAGATVDVNVTLYTNARAARTDARLELTDGRGRLVARLALDLPVVAGGASLAVDVPTTRDSSRESGRSRGARVAPPARLDEVEQLLPNAAALQPDAIAIVIGVERYRSLPDARFAARDAALVRRYATRVLGVPDDDQHLVVRTDAEASGSELRRLFGEDGWLARRVNGNTELFVYFAGHGAPDASGRVPYLLPADADGAYVSETGLALGTLYDRLARLPARSITIALDACFSGQTRERRALVAGTRPGTLSIEHPALVRRNMAVLAAARDAQAAGDLADARHGAFTWYLARGLRGEADSDGDAAITVAELGRFVERGVSRAAAEAGREQRPLTIARDSLRAVARLSTGARGR